MDVARNISEIKESLPEGVKLIAVSKTQPAEVIMAAYYAGQRIFGENKVQELVSKYEALPRDIEWHFIGHPQTNKIKYIAPFVALIHGVDSLKLLQVVDREGKKNNRTIPCLLQFHIAEEETKFGLSPDEAKEILRSDVYLSMQNVNIAGVMGMATFTTDIRQIEREFATLKDIFDMLKGTFFSGDSDFKEISMGMSDDFPVAIKAGSTMVRIGSKIFGARNYNITN